MADQYSSGNVPNLSSCISDAQSIWHYFVDSLGVPTDHILMLVDNDATRAAIIQAFQYHFIDNSRIVKGDAILFYFAGHGSRYMAPTGWTTVDGKWRQKRLMMSMLRQISTARSLHCSK
jgi:hypothetical protein